jgi:hypothetical protein
MNVAYRFISCVDVEKFYTHVLIVRELFLNEYRALFWTSFFLHNARHNFFCVVTAFFFFKECILNDYSCKVPKKLLS